MNTPATTKPDYRARVLLLVGVSAAARMIMAAHLPLGDDEAFYWLWAQHPAACYFDHPGMIAWLVRLSCEVFGDTALAVRLPAIVAGGISTWLMFLLGRRLFSDLTGWWAAIGFTVIPIYALGSVLVASDAPMGVFWLLATLAVAETCLFGRRAWWYVAGLCVGLALDSKYVAVLLPSSMLAFLLTGRTARQELRRKEIYIALGIAALVFSPVFLWNAEHHWASFVFNLTGRHGSGRLRLVSFAEMLGSQMLALSPLVLFSLVAALARSARMRRGNARFRLLFWCSVVTLALFWGSSIVVRMKPHWPAPGYLTLIVAACALGAGVGGRKAQQAWLWSTLAVALLFTTLLHVQAFYRVLPLGAKDDNTNDLYGWDRVTPVVRREMETIQRETGRPAYLFADRYQFAAQLAWNLKAPYKAFSLDPQLDQFDFWIKSKQLLGSSGVFVREDRREAKPEATAAFASVREIARVPVYRQGKQVREFQILRVNDLRKIP
ncbi:MAG: glycosyltransferase family 39 protein [Armatimonadetes bacterium]|nr:glycosyltransferase family 39 protein [Armatimonadota bacterium]